VCTDVAHINTDECGAPERFTGCKLLAFPNEQGKLTPEHVRRGLAGRGDEHHVQASVVSVTQATEWGTLYSVDELVAITAVAHEHGLRVHLDGARLANSAAALNLDVRALTVDAGIDVVSFGGTKNGLMYGEAVVFLDPALGEHAHFVRKQAMQLPSKMRYVAAQFDAVLTDGLWLENARQANAMAGRLHARVHEVPGVKVDREPEANSVFARLPHDAIAALQAESFFWIWDEPTDEVRWMTSFDTTEADVDEFVALVERVLAGT
jgi:threonine aldolase